LEDIVDFLEGSFGAFQHFERTRSSPWAGEQLQEALLQLRRHELIEEGESATYHLTSLGQYAGASGVHVESIIRVVAALRGIPADAISDPTLIAATQLTVKLDDVYFPINRKSTRSEPQAWSSELQRQGVADQVIRAFHSHVESTFDAVLRAKRTVACLLWISELPLSEVERILMRFGGIFDGAAGPIRATSSRTCDLPPAVTHIINLLNPDGDFEARCRRLVQRHSTILG
jgi:helicase